MPSATSRSTLARQWELLKLLPPKGPGITTIELQTLLSDAGHVTTKRTIERDLVELSRLFPLQCNNKGMPYGWHWMPGKSAELPGITLGEALTLRLVEDSIRPLIPAFMLKALEPRFNLARQKLEAMSEENPSARWLEKVASVQPELTQIPPEVKTDLLETIQQALLNDLQLSCRYYSAHKKQFHNFTLNPLGLVQRAHTSYLIATVEPFDDIRQFVVHRFEEAEILNTPCEKPEGFDLQAYISSGAMQFGTHKKIQFEAWVSEGLARLLQETPISNDMLLIPAEGGSRLAATVNDSWELKWWILSHAGSIRVEQPEYLREEITERLQQGLNLQTEL
ncbi:helix-turn-helix transcriptional regulator [Stutzerimonas sp. NM35]